MGEFGPEPCWNKELMEELYIDRGLSANQIAEKIGESSVKVLNWLRKHDLYDGTECPGCNTEYMKIGNHFKNNPECRPDDPSKNPLLDNYICYKCGDQYSRKQQNHSMRKFCSNDCRLRWMSEDYVEFRFGPGISWIKVAERIRERDNYRCQYCGMSNQEHREEYGCSLHVHHIIPAKQFDEYQESNKEENLVTLCHQHHVDWESIPVFPSSESNDSVSRESKA